MKTIFLLSSFFAFTTCQSCKIKADHGRPITVADGENCAQISANVTELQIEGYYCSDSVITNCFQRLQKIDDNTEWRELEDN